MKIKRFISYILVIAALVILVSCGSTSNNDKASIDESSNTDIIDPGSNNQGDDDQSQSKTEDNYYTITFKNDDGTVLKKADYKEGAMPSYDGTPSKDNTAEYTYTFNGWNPSIEAVSNDMVYTATYLSTKNSYTVTWKNWDGTVLEIDYNVEYGMTPIYNGSTPTRQSNQNNNYVFNGWDKIITSVTKDIEYTATFEAVPVSLCIVNFDSKGGSSISSQSVIKGEKVQKPSNPTKEGYTFDDWYYQGERWSFIGYTVTENMTLEAKWNINYYNLNLNANNSKAGTISNNSGSHYYNKSITITATTNLGYTFIGWYNGDNELTKELSYTFTMPAENLVYTAKWTANTNTPYKLEHYLQNIDDDNYPSTPYEIDNLTGTTDTLTNGSVKTYEGFTSPSPITQKVIKGDESTVIKLYYVRNEYNLTIYACDNKGDILSESGPVKYQREFSLLAPEKEGYTFIGWYEGDYELTKELSYTFTMPAKNLVLELRFSINKYTITIDNQVEGVTISGITSGNEYDYNSLISLSATNIPSSYTIKWERSDGDIYVGDNYGFKLPSSNIIISASISKPYLRANNKLYFGTYPQTKVTDNTLINELNTLAGTKPTSTNKYNWTDYNYYIDGSITSFMFYQDIDYYNNGTYDYRGVYFIQYRPVSPFTSASYQDDNGYSTNTIYWFKYDLIEWNILDEASGKALIFANLLLDSQEYCASKSDEEYEHNGGIGYSSNYELSNIRKWLNDIFYNTAFNDLQKSLIETITVDNTSSSTNLPSYIHSNNYACNNTNDKMLLLSYKEATTYFTSDSARCALGTDYAKCQGLDFGIDRSYNPVYYEWWLRSPSHYVVNVVSTIEHSGYIYNAYIYFTSVGVRPACWIIL